MVFRYSTKTITFEGWKKEQKSYRHSGFFKMNMMSRHSSISVQNVGIVKSQSWNKRY